MDLLKLGLAHVGGRQQGAGGGAAGAREHPAAAGRGHRPVRRRAARAHGRRDRPHRGYLRPALPSQLYSPIA
ncbi:hypothetical protein ON010_g18839 [Phytophthora cinnamomi]|nr:hypothetical protein ON010_g18839 [Phytophthora cinnamomi]